MDNNIKDLWTSIVRLAVKQARQITNDQDALTLKPLYKQWEKQIGRQLEVGEYLQYGNRLYKVLQQHVVQESWIPGIGTESLYMVIDKEHEGTLEDPIPWNKNMECFEGKYYIEDDILYICIRNSGIALQNNIVDLIGNYFDVYIENKVEDKPMGNPDINKDEIEEPKTEILEGELENPINVMNISLPIAYELNKYYKEGEVVYKCIREEKLHFYPSALVGHYFEII